MDTDDPIIPHTHGRLPSPVRGGGDQPRLNLAAPAPTTTAPATPGPATPGPATAAAPRDPRAERDRHALRSEIAGRIAALARRGTPTRDQLIEAAIQAADLRERLAEAVDLAIVMHPHLAARIEAGWASAEWQPANPGIAINPSKQEA